jgi:hypothetical protein
MSRGFWRGFAYLCIQGYQLLIRACDAFCYPCVMHCYVLREKPRLLELLTPSFSVLHSFLLLIVVIIFVGRNDTLEVNSGLRLLV